MRNDPDLNKLSKQGVRGYTFFQARKDTLNNSCSQELVLHRLVVWKCNYCFAAVQKYAI